MKIHTDSLSVILYTIHKDDITYSTEKVNLLAGRFGESYTLPSIHSTSSFIPHAKRKYR